MSHFSDEEGLSFDVVDVVKNIHLCCEASFKILGGKGVLHAKTLHNLRVESDAVSFLAPFGNGGDEDLVKRILDENSQYASVMQQAKVKKCKKNDDVLECLYKFTGTRYEKLLPVTILFGKEDKVLSIYLPVDHSKSRKSIVFEPREYEDSKNCVIRFSSVRAVSAHICSYLEADPAGSDRNPIFAYILKRRTFTLGENLGDAVQAKISHIEEIEAKLSLLKEREKLKRDNEQSTKKLDSVPREACERENAQVFTDNLNASNEYLVHSKNQTMSSSKWTPLEEQHVRDDYGQVGTPATATYEHRSAEPVQPKIENSGPSASDSTPSWLNEEYSAVENKVFSSQSSDALQEGKQEHATHSIGTNVVPTWNDVDTNEDKQDELTEMDSQFPWPSEDKHSSTPPHRPLDSYPLQLKSPELRATTQAGPNSLSFSGMVEMFRAPLGTRRIEQKQANLGLDSAGFTGISELFRMSPDPDLGSPRDVVYEDGQFFRSPHKRQPARKLPSESPTIWRESKILERPDELGNDEEYEIHHVQGDDEEYQLHHAEAIETSPGRSSMGSGTASPAQFMESKTAWQGKEKTNTPVPLDTPANENGKCPQVGDANQSPPRSNQEKFEFLSRLRKHKANVLKAKEMEFVSSVKERKAFGRSLLQSLENAACAEMHNDEAYDSETASASSVTSISVFAPNSPPCHASVPLKHQKSPPLRVDVDNLKRRDEHTSEDYEQSSPEEGDHVSVDDDRKPVSMDIFFDDEPGKVEYNKRVAKLEALRARKISEDMERRKRRSGRASKSARDVPLKLNTERVQREKHSAHRAVYSARLNTPDSKQTVKSGLPSFWGRRDAWKENDGQQPKRTADTCVFERLSKPTQAAAKTQETVPPEIEPTIRISGKSNLKVIINAITHVCLAGSHHLKRRENLLHNLHAKINSGNPRYQGLQYVILFRNEVALKFRGVYVVVAGTGELFKLQGGKNLPQTLNASMIDTFFKYNTGQKRFERVSSKTVTKTTDAVALNPKYFVSIGQTY
mmetsp:Transcript_42400/g.68047  ORF Transcript_42400/g.68047 Transcript_42400/m.68047 type:complete len:1019 (-) Transcript_42400:1722-4778(-)|eukprot:CAMPEP_0203763432 /NCGR_PEP_ID=MMETSP0098-20131031/16181_1 /ASSEMBLY_ACC=CAM_ASM_000208 /TAXON_ID=96639 /ORGANISM=" , Strain NY0313808BC1" /LENGTH=1018 /DNA_ID=CAMNT_0050658251 /DNA_START=408 /DNA_END=3464 /DNA_ORIENTATION=+